MLLYQKRESKQNRNFCSIILFLENEKGLIVYVLFSGSFFSVFFLIKKKRKQFQVIGDKQKSRKEKKKPKKETKLELIVFFIIFEILNKKIAEIKLYVEFVYKSKTY